MKNNESKSNTMYTFTSLKGEISKKAIVFGYVFIVNATTIALLIS